MGSAYIGRFCVSNTDTGMCLCVFVCVCVCVCVGGGGGGGGDVFIVANFDYNCGVYFQALVWIVCEM